MRLIPKRKIEGSEELMNSLALEKTAAKLPLDDTAVDGRTQEGITSNWAYDHNAAKTAVHAAGANDLLNTGDVDDTPVDDATTAPVSSNWAYEHNAKTTGTHGVTGTIVGTEDLDDISQAEPTRALETNYQNGTKIRIAVVSLKETAGSSASVFTVCVKSSSPADDIIAHTYCAPAYMQTVTFVVPPSYYYKIAETGGGTGAIDEWHEWDLL